MKKFLKQLYLLNREQLKLLMGKYTEERLLASKQYFVFEGANIAPVTTLRLFYYIDSHGNFLEKGKKCHHNIARAIFESMNNHHKVEVMQYIEDLNEEENEDGRS